RAVRGAEVDDVRVPVRRREGDRVRGPPRERQGDAARDAEADVSPRVEAALVILLLAGCGEEPVVVDARTVTRVELRGCADPIDAGAAGVLQNAQFNAAGEQVIEQPLSWRSDNPAIATVQPGGRVTGVADGATTIHATVGTAATSAAVVVRSRVAVVRLAGC